jgi:Na+/H+ antiporter NhaC
MTAPTDEELRTALELKSSSCLAAAPLPWHVETVTYSNGAKSTFVVASNGVCPYCSEHDVAYIAAACTLFPGVAKELLELREKGAKP